MSNLIMFVGSYTLVASLGFANNIPNEINKKAQAPHLNVDVSAKPQGCRSFNRIAKISGACPRDG